jgi:glutamine synthetase
LTKQIVDLRKGGKTAEEAVAEVARKTLKDHSRIIFNGNNYSSVWHEEAAKRGLPNLRDTPSAYSVFNSEKNQKLFSSLGVLTNEELEARQAVGFNDYNHKLHIEGKSMVDLAYNYVLPTATEYQTKLATSIDVSSRVLKTSSDAQLRFLKDINTTTGEAISRLHQLEHQLEEAHKVDDTGAQAKFIAKHVVPSMQSLRQSCDHLEQLSPASSWPLPSYLEMLHHQD